MEFTVHIPASAITALILWFILGLHVVLIDAASKSFSQSNRFSGDFWWLIPTLALIWPIFFRKAYWPIVRKVRLRKQI